MSAPTPRTLAGIVVSAGKMMKTVKVRIAQQVFNRHIRKYFPSSTTHLVHDPTSILREGDIVRIAAGWRVSRRKRHVVTEVVAAFGKAVEERVALVKEGEGTIAGEGEGQGEGRIERRGLVGMEELIREREERRKAKRERREGRRRERVGHGEAETEGGSGEGR